jgi:SNF2 family DNA or RNA helicase
LIPLYPHQEKEVNAHALASRRALFWDKRCGKSKGASACVAKLPGFERGIVVAPLSVCPAWTRELTLWGFTPISIYDMGRESAIEAMRAAYKGDGGFVVTSWRRIAAKTPQERKEGKECRMLRALLAYRAHGLIVDESDNAASPSSAQARGVRRIAKQTEWVRLLTGTPSPNHFGNLWGQLVMLHPTLFGKSYREFASRYLILDQMFPSRVLGHKNVEELQALMMPFVSLARREDIFGPDQWIENTVNVALPAQARMLYDKLASEWVVDDPEFGRIDASSVLKRLVRLQQVASGYAPDDMGAVRVLHTAKVDAIVDDLEDIVKQGDKAVVFHRFRREGDDIAARTAKFAQVYRINGDVPVDERQRAIDAMAAPGPRVAIVQTLSGGVGVSFAEVPYQLVASQSFSYRDEDQAHDRTFKPGHARFVTYYRTEGTVDDFIAEALAGKKDVNDAVRNADKQTMSFGRIYRPRMRK